MIVLVQWTPLSRGSKGDGEGSEVSPRGKGDSCTTGKARLTIDLVRGSEPCE